MLVEKDLGVGNDRLMSIGLPELPHFLKVY